MAAVRKIQTKPVGTRLYELLDHFRFIRGGTKSREDFCFSNALSHVDDVNAGDGWSQRSHAAASIVQFSLFIVSRIVPSWSVL